MSANGGDNSAGRLQQAQQQVGEVVDIMRVNVEKVKVSSKILLLNSDCA